MPDTWLTLRQRDAVTAAADRLANLVNTCPEGHRPLDPSCPFCADELAYDELLAAFPTLIERGQQPEGRAIALRDIRRDPEVGSR